MPFAAILNPDVASMRFDDTVRDRQTHSSSSRLPLIAFAHGPEKLVEDAFAQLSWYAWSLIFNNHANGIIVARFRGYLDN